MMSVASRRLLDKVVEKKLKASPASFTTVKKIRADKDRVVSTDLWSTTVETISEESHLPMPSPPVRKPSFPMDKLHLITKSKAVKVVSGGASYNPRFDLHQASLALAVKQETDIAAARERAESRLAYPAALDDLEDGMGVDYDDGENEEETDVNGGISFNEPVRSESRKDQKQRNKDARRIENERLQAARAAERRIAGEVNAIGDIAKRVKKELAKKAAVIEGAIDASSVRLGPQKFKGIPLALQVPLTEDLSGSLLGIKPEGNLFKDRFNSIQERCLVEPRIPRGRKRRFANLSKQIEIHSYKRFK